MLMFSNLSCDADGSRVAHTRPVSTQVPHAFALSMAEPLSCMHWNVSSSSSP